MAKLVPCVGWAYVALLFASAACSDGEPRSGQPEITAPRSTSDLVKQCLEDRGYEVTPMPNELLKVDASGGQSSTQQASDVADCSTQFAEALQSGTEDTEALRKRYNDFLAVVDCMDALGYGSPDGPPTFERFDALGGEWSPYDALLADPAGSDLLPRVAKECPLPGMVQVTVQ